MGRTARLWLGLAVTITVYGCGATQKPAATHETFRAAQALEAGIDRGVRGARNDDLETRCASLKEVDSQVEALCKLAEDHDDLDLRTRCERARARCEREGGCGAAQPTCTNEPR